MNRQNFWVYNGEAEELGKDYWKFLNATIDDLKKEDITLNNIFEVVNKITNPELKQKMINKIHDLIIENGIFEISNIYVLVLFDKEEIKRIIEKEVNDNLDTYTSNETNLKYYSINIDHLMSAFEKYGQDYNWKLSMNRKVLDRIKNYSNKLLIRYIEASKNHNDIYNALIDEYYDYLPIEYKNYIKIQRDPFYMMNKAKQFENIDIGIDSNISIGPEIEANIDYAFSLDLQNQIGFDNYSVSNDSTVSNGDEVNTIKPFHNVPSDVAKFCALCETMKDVGYYYSEVDGDAAGQINLGLDYLDTKESILNFYEIYGNCEELLYYISSEEGQLFRQNVYTNSRIKALSEIIGRRVLDEELTRLDVIKLFNKTTLEDDAIDGLLYKKNSVCLRGSYDGDFRLEFRIPNGGCNYKTWIDNIRLYGKMLEAAKKLADMMKKDYLTSEEEKMIKLKINMQDASLSLEEKLHMLMDLLFEDNSIKQIYYDRYNATIRRINETQATNYENHNHHEPNFDTVLFEEQYHSRLDPDYIDKNSIEYDPDEGIIKH